MRKILDYTFLGDDFEENVCIQGRVTLTGDPTK